MIIKLKNGKYYDARSFGVDTWGTSSQTSMYYSNGKWYETSAVCTDPENDTWEQEETLLDVEEEFTDIPAGVKIENETDYITFNYLMSGEFDEEKITE